MELQSLNIDLTVTKNCNFGCSYCFEKGKHENKEMSEETFDKIIDFMKKYKYLYSFMIMGGEPSISKNLKYFFRKLKKEIENNNIKLNKKKLSVYITNGYKIEKVFDHFEDLEFWKKYFQIQISYDGRVIQDKYRKTLDGKLTSDIILKNFEIANEYFLTTFKSTLNIYDFNHIEEIIKEFIELKTKYPHIQYDVTENKSSFIFNTEKIMEIVKEYFPIVLKYEKKFYDKNNTFITRWLTDAKLGSISKCSAGVNMIHISPDEIVSPCHLSLYQENKIEYGKLDENFEKQFQKYTPYFLGVKEDKCKDCSAVFCLRCPMDKYNRDQNLLELYNGIDDKICFYYQEISKYIFYLYKKLNLF